MWARKIRNLQKGETGLESHLLLPHYLICTGHLTVNKVSTQPRQLCRKLQCPLAAAPCWWDHEGAVLLEPRLQSCCQFVLSKVCRVTELANVVARIRTDLGRLCLQDIAALTGTCVGANKGQDLQCVPCYRSVSAAGSLRVFLRRLVGRS